jgi:hypothetical protein
MTPTVADPALINFLAGMVTLGFFLAAAFFLPARRPRHSRLFSAKTTKVFAEPLLFTSVLLDFCSLHVG